MVPESKSDVQSNSEPFQIRTASEQEVCRFLSDIRHRVGGTAALAAQVAEIGYLVGPATVRSWIRGDHAPAPAVLLALAAVNRISLDEYAFARDVLGAVIDQMTAKAGSA